MAGLHSSRAIDSRAQNRNRITGCQAIVSKAIWLAHWFYSKTEVRGFWGVIFLEPPSGYFFFPCPCLFHTPGHLSHPFGVCQAKYCGSCGGWGACSVELLGVSIITFGGSAARTVSQAAVALCKAFLLSYSRQSYIWLPQF